MSIKNWLLLCLIVFCAGILRFVFVGVPALNGDEGDNLDSVVNFLERDVSPWERWGGLLPPMSSWMFSLFVSLLGFSEFALRFVGVFFSSLTVVLVFFLAKLHYGTKTGLLSAFFYSVLPLIVLSSRDAHPDNVLLFFSVLSVLLFEYGFKSKSFFYFFVGGLSAGLAILSKSNAILLFVLYWLFVAIVSLKNFRKNLKYFFAAVFSAAIVVFLSFGFDVRNFFYFVNGILFWVFNQNLVANVPWFYSFSVLFDGLSPLLFVFFPFAVLIIFLSRKRNSLLDLFVCLAFLIMVTLQGRKFPRHFLLAFPFVVMVFSNALFLLRKYFFKKIFVDVFIVLLLLSAGVWSVYKIVGYNDYVVWRDVGKFILSISDKNSTVYVYGLEFWTLKYYTNYERRIVSKLKPGFIRTNDIIIVHSLNKSTPFFIGSPLQNDLTLYSSKYAEQYEFNDDFYSFVRKYGVLLKTFDYDKLGNKILVYRIGSFLPKIKVNQSASFELDLMTRRVCDVWLGNGSLKSLMKFALPSDMQTIVDKKCTKGCVTTCGIL